MVLLDTIFKLHFAKYELRVGGFLEKFNDIFVLFCSYMLFYFTDFVITPTNKEAFGFAFIGSVLMMAATNIGILLGVQLVKTCKEYRVQKRKAKLAKLRLKQGMLIRKSTTQRKLQINKAKNAKLQEEKEKENIQIKIQAAENWKNKAS